MNERYEIGVCLSSFFMYASTMLLPFLISHLLSIPILFFLSLGHFAFVLRLSVAQQQNFRSAITVQETPPDNRPLQISVDSVRRIPNIG